MAVFNRNEELTRQAQRIGMDKVKGGRKVAMAMLGYKDDGTKNLWGKINPGQLTPGYNTLSNIAARGLSKGTDTNAVLKEQTDEALGTDMAALNFAKQVATTVGTGGAGGSLGSVFGSGKMGKLGSVMGIGKKDLPMDLTPDAEGAQKAIDESNIMDSNANNLDSWKTKKMGEGYTFNNGMVYDADGNELGTEEDMFNKDSFANYIGDPSVSDKNPSSGQGLLSKANSLIGGLKGGDVSGLVGAGLELGTNIVSHHKAGDEKNKEMNSQSKMSNFSYL